MLTKKIECMQPDSFIFMEIACQQNRGGADISVIREGVDYRQKMLLSDVELRESIERLKALNFIVWRNSKFFISEPLASSLPRTTPGQLSFRRREWDKLRKRLFEP